jgi:hypothetical protein
MELVLIQLLLVTKRLFRVIRLIALYLYLSLVSRVRVLKWEVMVDFWCVL